MARINEECWQTSREEPICDNLHLNESGESFQKCHVHVKTRDCRGGAGVICLKRAKQKAWIGLESYAENDYVIIPVDVVIETESAMKAADDFRCWPPPWFIIAISVMQLLLFAHYTFLEDQFSHSTLLKSMFLWKPAATLYAWRFFFYSLYHIGWLHLCFNLAVQLCVGVPLEMIHGASRVAVVYLTGVTVGALSTILVDTELILVGSSSGVYALLAAHLADVILNHSQMELGRLKVVAVLIIAMLDITLALVDQPEDHNNCAVSHIAHVTGALTGMLVALAFLKTFKSNDVTEAFQRGARVILFVVCLLMIWSCLVGPGGNVQQKIGR